MPTISSLSLPRNVKTALLQAQYHDVDDLLGLNPEDLCSELAISRHEATDLLRQADEARAGPSHTHVVVDPSTSTDIRQHVHALTASELLSTASPRCFSTFSSALDGLIERSLTGSFSENGNADGEGRRLAKRGRHHGAISPGMVVEISGPPGGGKTVLSIALVLSARIGALETSAAPSGQFGQTKGEVLIIDTEGSITPERLLHAAQAAVRASEISPVSILDGIHLIRVATQVQMVALLHTLDEWLDSHPATELVVFDTLSFHFRHPGLDLGVKRRLMELAKQEIARASTMHGCAVVVNNQLATKLLTAENKPANFDTGDRAVLMPQLGDSWATSKALRLVLFRGGLNDDQRHAHASTADGHGHVPWVKFDIDLDGLPCDTHDSL